MFHFRVRNGTGWGHWAMTTRFLLDSRFVASSLSLSLPGYRYRWVWVVCCFFVAFSALLRQADIRVAMCVGFQVLRFL